ncbi:MAG: hypothetical protein HY719_12700 [Planctomycetes bacterium]|nr:hypothetical protein [Planctomycetota bacterium]
MGTLDGSGSFIQGTFVGESTDPLPPPQVGTFECFTRGYFTTTISRAGDPLEVDHINGCKAALVILRNTVIERLHIIRLHACPEHFEGDAEVLETMKRIGLEELREARKQAIEQVRVLFTGCEREAKLINKKFPAGMGELWESFVRLRNRVIQEIEDTYVFDLGTLKACAPPPPPSGNPDCTIRLTALTIPKRDTIGAVTFNANDGGATVLRTPARPEPTMVCLSAAGVTFTAKVTTPAKRSKGEFRWIFLDAASKWTGGVGKFASIFTVSGANAGVTPTRDGSALVVTVAVRDGDTSSVSLGATSAKALACLQIMAMTVAVSYVGDIPKNGDSKRVSCADAKLYAAMPKRTLHVCLRPFINRGAATDKDLFEGDQAPASRGRLQRQVNAIFEDICTVIEVHEGSAVDGDKLKVPKNKKKTLFDANGRLLVDDAFEALKDANKPFANEPCINVYLVSGLVCGKDDVRSGCSQGNLADGGVIVLTANETDPKSGTNDARILAHEIGHLFDLDHLTQGEGNNGLLATEPEPADSPVNLSGTVRGVVDGGDPAKDKTQNLMLATLIGDPQDGFPVTWRDKQIQKAAESLAKFACEKGKKR